MSKITITKYLTEHPSGRRLNKETGKWEARCDHEPAHVKVTPSIKGRGMMSVREWHEVEEPRTMEYHEAHAAGMRGGTVTTKVEVEGDAFDGQLSAEDVKRIARSLLTVYKLHNPDISGRSRESMMESMEERLRIEDLLVRLGADRDNLRANA